ncbi:MAG: protein kinase, partial [Planctomycetes bacterium]|nr:protein kinase [Planctomycetota bacterium]
MDTEHLKNEELLYHTAAAKPLAERMAYLRDACRDDPALFARLTALLQSREERGTFLEVPPVGENILLDDSLMTEGPGTIIGRYKLLEKIGEGGMAVVYLAEQTEPLRRKVALKIIKLGMDTRQVIARFEAERQALALMDHPSIAKVLDAGATETGRPYFVMELVQGVSITEYCDRNSLSTKERLTLFLQVCNAVQHAHQKGIIHRDIKPSNVMITHHDGKPVPKVIDFGIAKATNQKLTEKTLFTRYAHIIGTPAYMSPEQAELSDLDIDTRSDIYSLGVLLYELLTGTTPFSEEELRKAGYLEMQRVIREQEPVRPSTRIRTALRSANVPARRGIGILPMIHGRDAHATTSCEDARPTKTMGGTPMLREVRGDLDWIVMKSLEKDRARRYDTASGLAEDIRRHLEHEPILARGPTTAYRLGKFLRRHRVQVLVGVIAAILVAIAGVLLSIWNQDRLRWNRDRLQLVEAERLQHEDLLDRARDQYAKAEREAALKTIQSILDSPYVGGQARLLRAGILVDNRRFQEATAILGSLLQERPEIAGTAHALLARILWESEPLDAEKLKEFEEHRRQAETRQPETAEAYFLRAMTAPTIREQLAALDKALQLTPEHYESLRLRAFTYYASRKYTRMREDALGMTYLRRGDPLGYSLRAIALRELGEYEDAITEYDHALARLKETDPQYLDLITQRSATLLRKGDYERVVAEASVGAKDLSPLQYHRFAALTALGNYDKAAAVFEEIVHPGQEARQQFRNWCAKYVFDNLQAGRSWHPGNDAPAGPAFLPMAQAEETFGALSAKGRRITTDGFSAQWSPDGRKLAFSLGVQGRSGVALFDPATNQTDLLIVPGKYPKWSPDGRYIAFVRDRQFLRQRMVI